MFPYRNTSRPDTRSRRIAAAIAILLLTSLAISPINLAWLAFTAAALAIPGFLTRTIRYRAAADVLLFLADLFLLGGLACQLFGETLFPAMLAGGGELPWILAIGACHLLAVVLFSLAILELRFVRRGETTLRLKDLSRTDQFAYWFGFASLGRSPGLVRQELAQAGTPPGLKAELRRHRRSLVVLGLVIGALMVPGAWLSGLASGPGRVDSRLWSVMYLGFLSLIGAGGYSYWLWRLSRVNRLYRDRSADWMQCVNCGYSLRGLTTRRCPECGTPF